MKYRHLTTRIPSMPGELKRSEKGNRPIELDAEQQEWLRQYFPTTLNCIIMEKSGLSHSSMHRLARKYGLTKDAARSWSYMPKSRDSK